MTKNNDGELMYEAILNDVHFPWPSYPPENREEAERTLRQWLDKYTNGYTVSDFYLLNKNKEGE
jgi:hypothetical protein